MHQRARGDDHALLFGQQRQRGLVRVQQCLYARLEQRQRMAGRHAAGHLAQGGLPVVLGDDPYPGGAVAVDRDGLLAGGLDDLGQTLIELLHSHFRVAFHSAHCPAPRPVLKASSA